MTKDEKNSKQHRLNQIVELKLHCKDRTDEQTQHNYIKKNAVASRRLLFKNSNWAQRRQPRNNHVTVATGIRISGFNDLRLELRVTSLRAGIVDAKKRGSGHLLPENVMVKIVQNSALAKSDSPKFAENNFAEHVAKRTTHNKYLLQNCNKTPGQSNTKTDCRLGTKTDNKMCIINDSKGIVKKTANTALVCVGLDKIKEDIKKRQEMVLPQLIVTIPPDHINPFGNEENIRERTKEDNRVHCSPEIQRNKKHKGDIFIDSADDYKKTLLSVMPLIFTPPSNHKVSSFYSSGVESGLMSRYNSTFSPTRWNSYLSDRKISRILTSRSPNEATNRGQPGYQTCATIRAKPILLEVFSERRRNNIVGLV